MKIISREEFFARAVSAFNNSQGGGADFTKHTPAVLYERLLAAAAACGPGITEVQHDTVVLTFWHNTNCAFSINLLRWPDYALNQLFDLVLPWYYDNRI